MSLVIKAGPQSLWRPPSDDDLASRIPRKGIPQPNSNYFIFLTRVNDAGDRGILQSEALRGLLFPYNNPVKDALKANFIAREGRSGTYRLYIAPLGRVMLSRQQGKVDAEKQLVDYLASHLGECSVTLSPNLVDIDRFSDGTLSMYLRFIGTLTDTSHTIILNKAYLLGYDDDNKINRHSWDDIKGTINGISVTKVLSRSINKPLRDLVSSRIDQGVDLSSYIPIVRGIQRNSATGDSIRSYLQQTTLSEVPLHYMDFGQ